MRAYFYVVSLVSFVLCASVIAAGQPRTVVPTPAKSQLRSEQQLLDSLADRLQIMRNRGGPDLSRKQADEKRLAEVKQLVAEAKANLSAASRGQQASFARQQYQDQEVQDRVDERVAMAQWDQSILQQEQIVRSAQQTLTDLRRGSSGYQDFATEQTAVAKLNEARSNLDSLKLQRNQAKIAWAQKASQNHQAVRQQLNSAQDLKDRAQAQLNDGLAEQQAIEQRISEWNQRAQSDQKELQDLEKSYQAQKAKVEALKATAK